MHPQRRNGLLLLGLALVLAAALGIASEHIMRTNEYLHQQCTLPADICPINRGLPAESIIGFGAIGALGLYGLWLIRAPQPLGPAQRRSRRNGNHHAPAPAPAAPAPKPLPANLSPNERTVVELLRQSDNIALQGDLVQRTGFSKVKVSRVLDHLEARGLVERRRRGMSNVVILKTYQRAER